jgi:hypothetical protein
MSECDLHEEEEEQVKIFAEIELNGNLSSTRRDNPLFKKISALKPSQLESAYRSFFSSPLINLDSNDNCDVIISVLNSALSNNISSIDTDKNEGKLNNSGVGKSSILQSLFAHEYSLEMKGWNASRNGKNNPKLFNYPVSFSIYLNMWILNIKVKHHIIAKKLMKL